MKSNAIFVAATALNSVDKSFDIAATQQKLEAGDLLTFEEISLTSLQRFELMMQIEDQFSIELDEGEVEAINSVAATVEKIRTLQLNLSSV